MRQKKLFLLDAYALIYRAYYAFLRNPRINSKGQNTSAIFGFVNTLEDILKREQPTHIAVVFDPPGPTFRHEAYEQYKAQRQETPEDIRAAVPLIKQIVEGYRIPVIEVLGYEADDVIGALAKQGEAAGFDVYMMTPDKDYGQLVSDHIFIYKPKFGAAGFDTLGVEEVKQKFDVASPEQVIDLLGLMGDASDNIPGCPGVGEKSAAKLLKEFGSIDNLLLNTHQLKGALKEKIEQNAEQIRFSRFLATIKTDLPITLNEQEMIREQPDKARLTQLFTDLEFRAFLTKLNDAPTPVVKQTAPQSPSLFDEFVAPETIPAAEPTTAATLSHLRSAENTPHSYRIIESESALHALVAELSSHGEFCFALETTPTDALDAEVIGMAFSAKKQEAYYLPLPPDRAQAERLLSHLKPLFEAERIEKIGLNIKFDLIVLSNYGITVAGRLFDITIAHYLLQPELRHTMNYLADILMGYRVIEVESLIGKRGKSQRSMRDTPLEQVAEYLSEQADITLQLKELLESQLSENRLDQLFYEVEMPLVRVLARMEQHGVLIDDFALAQSSEVLTAQMQQIERSICQIAGEQINVSSPKQIGELLFDKLRIVEKAKKTKTGQYVTDEETLESLKSKHPIIEKILEYRGLKKLLSTYIDALPKLINPRTGKVHTSFNQTITATGRLSSSNPNLQNIPIRNAQGKEIRKAFIAEAGCLFLSADYSQIELRIMAHLSGDQQMLSAFAANQDIHAATAANIYKIPIEEVTSDMRRKAKTANFGIIYGISAFGLSERLAIPRTEAKELIDGYFESFPQVHQYMDACIEKARHTGYVETLLHRKRFLPDINSNNANVRGFAERNAINAPIQGTAADIIKIAMVRIDKALQTEGLKTKMILQVHDELNFNVPTEEVEQVKALIVKEMESAIALQVPLRVDMNVGNNWLEAH